MSIEVGQVKTFTLITGMEILGKVKEINDKFVSVTEAFNVRVQTKTDADGNPMGINVNLELLTPFALQQSKSGGLDVELYFGSILLSTNPPEALVTQYSTQTGTIIAPPSKKIRTL